MTNALSPGEKVLSSYQGTQFRRYEPADRRVYQTDARSYLSTVAVTHLGALRVAGIADRRGTICITEPPGQAAHCLCVVKRGSVELRSTFARQSESAGGNTGLIYSGSVGTKITSSDDNERLTIWIPSKKLKVCLEGLADRSIMGDLEFTPRIELSNGFGASIHGILLYIEQELSRSDSMLSQQVGSELIEDLLCRSLLQGLQHNHSERLQRPQPAAGPRNVRRAEDYLRAHLTDRITLGDLARAGKCSVRSLQLAFQEARGTTPMAALRQARLEKARQMLVQQGSTTSVTDVALMFGFSNPGRFAGLYLQAFGETPGQTLRGRLNKD